VQRFQASKWLRTSGWTPAVATVLLLLFLGVQFLARSAAAHQFIHHDAKAPGHHCVVTVVAEGLLDFTPAPQPIAADSILVPHLPRFVAAEHGIRAHRLPDGRAPPRCA